MNTTISASALLEMYESELWQYAGTPEEIHLIRGYELGREAADTGIGLLQLSEAHHRVLGRMVQEFTSAGISESECELRLSRAAEFFAESLASFEMVYQGYRAQIAILEEQGQRLVAAQENAERANNAKSEFLSGMSHELRTPLNAIMGFCQILELDELDGEQREAIHHISNAGSHLLALINELLETARIESGQLDLRIEPISVMDVVTDTLDLASPLAKVQGVTLSAKQTTCFVLADSQRLKQVLVNLVANAIKYNHSGGSVHVSCKHEDHLARIAVNDTGIGIPEASVERLFMPFDRLGGDRTDIEGTGLGLAMVKRLTTAMGGAIGVQSVEGKGTTLWVEFTEAAPTAASRNVAAPSDVDVRDGKGPRTILYIEDNPSNAELVKRIFEQVPFATLLVAMSGAEGMALAQQHQPNLVLLDLNLPDISGEEVLRRLQANSATSAIPVAIVSADAMPERKAQLLSHGAAAYLTKPFEISQLLQVVETYATDSTANR